MRIIKNQLTFDESLEFVNFAIDRVFQQDTLGNDIEYNPALLNPSLKSIFARLYTDMEFLPTTDEEGNEIEGNFDKNFAEYMAIDIDEYINNNEINVNQYYEMCHAISDGIEFRKQKISQANNSVSKYVAELLQLQIENQKLQKKILQQTEKLNKQFTTDEIKSINENIGQLNQNMKNVEFQKGLVEAIDTVKPFKRPDDHKKSKKAK